MTINKHKGLFQYNRLHFWCENRTNRLFQQLMDTMLHDIPSVATHLDDVIVMGRDSTDLEHKLEHVFQTLTGLWPTCSSEKMFYLGCQV